MIADVVANSPSARLSVSLGLLVLWFLVCWAYAAYCWVTVLRERAPGVRWWAPVLSGDSLSDQGQRYARRFLASVLLGVVPILLALWLYPSR